MCATRKKLIKASRIPVRFGQSFDEPGLMNEGSFKAAEIRHTSVGEIKVTHLRRWLKKSKTIQWDYKNIVKRKAVLEKFV